MGQLHPRLSAGHFQPLRPHIRFGLLHDESRTGCQRWRDNQSGGKTDWSMERKCRQYQHLWLGAVDGRGRGGSGNSENHGRDHIPGLNSDRRLLSELFYVGPCFRHQPSAARAANNINISFPTQNGWGYRVFYKTNLTSGSWTLLNSTAGNGSVVSVTDSSPGDNQRFYKVTSP